MPDGSFAIQEHASLVIHASRFAIRLVGTRNVHQLFNRLAAYRPIKAEFPSIISSPARDVPVGINLYANYANYVDELFSRFELVRRKRFEFVPTHSSHLTERLLRRQAELIRIPGFWPLKTMAPVRGRLTRHPEIVRVGTRAPCRLGEASQPGDTGGIVISSNAVSGELCDIVRTLIPRYLRPVRGHGIVLQFGVALV